VPLLVVLEMIWVLESVYEVSRMEILDSIHDLLLMPVLKFDQQTMLRQWFLSAQGNNFDLADLLIAHVARKNGCEAVITFDKKAGKSSLFELLE
jgi:predicted nucleic-acid-binding protein